MQAIKDAGYTSVQTSPINQVIVDDGGNKSLKNWYYQYQPILHTIGHYQLGTEEFKEMNRVADQYSIKIMLSLTTQHLTTTKSVKKLKVFQIGHMVTKRLKTGMIVMM